MEPIYLFAGTFVENTARSESLVPLLREMGLSEKKIAQTTAAPMRQVVRVRPIEAEIAPSPDHSASPPPTKMVEIITEYETQTLGKTVDFHYPNRGKRVFKHPKTQLETATECRFNADNNSRGKNGETSTSGPAASSFPLRIVTALPKDRGMILDQRRLTPSGDLEQKLTYFTMPSTITSNGHTANTTSSSNDSTRGGKPNKVVSVRRLWNRLDPAEISVADAAVANFLGSWVLDEALSDSVVPLLERLNLPRGAIEVAAAMRTTLTVLPAGPGEVVLKNRTQNPPDVRYAYYRVGEKEPGTGGETDKEGKRRRSACFASDARTLHFHSEINGRRQTDVRVVNGETFVQRLSLVDHTIRSVDTPIALSRVWRRVESVPRFTYSSPLPDVITTTDAASSSAVPPSPIKTSPQIPTRTQEAKRTREDEKVDSRAPVPSENLTNPRTAVLTSWMYAVYGSMLVTLAGLLRSLHTSSSSSSKNVTSETSTRVFVASQNDNVMFFNDSLLEPALACVGVVTYLAFRRAVRLSSIANAISSNVIMPHPTLVSRLWVASLVSLSLALHAYLVVENAPLGLAATATFLILRFMASTRTGGGGDARARWALVVVSRAILVMSFSYLLPSFLDGSNRGEKIGAFDAGSVLAVCVIFSALARLSAGERGENGTVHVTPLFPFLIDASAMDESNAATSATSSSGDLAASARGKRPDAVDVTVSDVRIVEGHHAEYKVDVKSVKDGKSWTVWRRYSQFRILRAELPDALKDRERLDFPRRRWMNNLSSDVLEARRVTLDAFAKAVFDGAGPHASQVYPLSHSAKAFLGIPP